MPPGDPAAVSAAISRVLSDDSLAASLRDAALDAAAAWRPERMLSQYRSAYQAAAARETSVGLRAPLEIIDSHRAARWRRIWPRWANAEHSDPRRHG